MHILIATDTLNRCLCKASADNRGNNLNNFQSMHHSADIDCKLGGTNKPEKWLQLL